MTPENIEKVHTIVSANREVMFQKLADTLKIAKKSVMLHEYFSMTKLYSKWVPRLLPANPKQHRVDEFESFLRLFLLDKTDFVHRYVTMDETTFHSSSGSQLSG